MMKSDLSDARPRRLTAALLRRWPLPETGADADKEVRGQVLVIAGSHEIPGAAALAATAALRAGAGKLTIAAPRSIALGLALLVPESRTVALDETRAGGLAPGGRKTLALLAEKINAVVIGPGMLDETRSCAFVRTLLPLFRHATMVLDALAMDVIGKMPFTQPVIVTPHAGEMAHLCGVTKDAVAADPLGAARGAARRWNAVVVLKGAVTTIATPDGAAWQYHGSTPGLATSGSGDTLAGLIGGLAARGVPPVQAAAWGVVVHARAGEQLAAAVGPLGYLARELPAQMPRAIRNLCH